MTVVFQIRRSFCARVKAPLKHNTVPKHNFAFFVLSMQVTFTLLLGCTMAQNFYLQQGIDGSLGQPFMQPGIFSFSTAESNPKPSFFRKPFFSNGNGGGSRPPGKSFFGIRTPSFLSGLRGSASSPRPSFFSFGRPSPNVFHQQIPLTQLETSSAQASFQTLPLPAGLRVPFSPGPVLQQAPAHVAQATEYAESQAESDRQQSSFSGIPIFQQQGGGQFGGSQVHGEQDSYQQQVNSVVQLTPSASGGYSYKTDGSNVYNGIMTAQLGVPVSLSNYGDVPVAIPIGASGNNQATESGTDGHVFGHTPDSYSSSQGGSGQKAQQQDEQYSNYPSNFQVQQSSGTSYGSNVAGTYGSTSSSGTRYATAPSSGPSLSAYFPTHGGSPTSYALAVGNQNLGSGLSAYGGSIAGGYEPAISTQGSGSVKYGPAYTLVGTAGYGGSSSANYGGSQSSGYPTQISSYNGPSSSTYKTSSGTYNAPSRGYSSSQPGYTASYSSGTPSKYSSAGSGYSSGYGTSSAHTGSSVAYDNSPSSYDSHGNFGARYPTSSGHRGSVASSYTSKRPAGGAYPSTSTSYKNPQSASAALAHALKAYAAGNVKYVSAKPVSTNTGAAYSTTYSSTSGSAGYTEKTPAAAPYFRSKGAPQYNKYTDASLSFSDGAKTSSKSSFDQRTVGQTLRVSGGGANSSDSYTTSTRTTSSPSKSSTV